MPFGEEPLYGVGSRRCNKQMERDSPILLSGESSGRRDRDGIERRSTRQNAKDHFKSAPRIIPDVWAHMHSEGASFPKIESVE